MFIGKKEISKHTGGIGIISPYLFSFYCPIILKPKFYPFSVSIIAEGGSNMKTGD